jgi:hypothetical protein
MSAEMRQVVDQRPILMALGALAIGALCAYLLPLSSRERRILEPAKRKASERISTVASSFREQVAGGGDSGEDVGTERRAPTQASVVEPIPTVH